MTTPDPTQMEDLEARLGLITAEATTLYQAHTNRKPRRARDYLHEAVKNMAVAKGHLRTAVAIARREKGGGR